MTQSDREGKKEQERSEKEVVQRVCVAGAAQ